MKKESELVLHMSLILGNVGYILLDLPLRAIISLSIFLLLPGYLIIKALDLQLGSIWSSFIISITLSISFLMLFGFLFNHLFYSLGLENPLEYSFLGYSLIMIISSMFVFYNQNSEKGKISIFSSFTSLNITETFIIILSTFLIILSIFSANFVYAHDVVTYSILIYLLIPLIFVSIWLFRNKIDEKVYPFVVLSLALSIKIPLVFRSSYFYGVDIYASYYLAENVLARSHWSLFTGGTLISSLSITLLPPIVSLFSGMNLVVVFQLLMILTYGLIPVVLFLILRNFFDPIWAFTGSVFYISSMWFARGGVGLRTELAFLFVGMFVFILCCTSIKDYNKRYLLIVIASISIITSHYATTYAMGIILLFGLIWTLFKRNIIENTPTNNRGPVLINKIQIKIFFIYVVLMYLWNIYIISPFESAVETIQASILGFFYGTEEYAHQDAAAGALGEDMHILEHYLPAQIEYGIMWFMVITIFIGALWVLFSDFKINKIKSRNIFDSNNKESFITSHYSTIGFGGFIVAGILLLPGIDPGMGFGRTWGLLTLFFTPLFLLGSSLILKKIKIKKKQLLILVILAIYFISVTGVAYPVYERISEDSPEDLERFTDRVFHNRSQPQGKTYEIYEAEIHASRWLNTNSSDDYPFWSDGNPDYTHDLLKARIRIAGPFDEDQYTPWREGIRSFSNYSINEFENISGYIYLRYVNIEMREYTTTYRSEYESFEEIYSNFQTEKNYNKIYSNGGSEIYFTP